MARIKYFNPYTGKWEYADKQYAESSGGADKYDLEIPIYVPGYEGWGDLKSEHIGDVDWDAVRATHAKLTNGANVKVLIKGRYATTSGNPFPVNIYPSVVLAYDDAYLYVYFLLPTQYYLRTTALITFGLRAENVGVQVNEITQTDFKG